MPDYARSRGFHIDGSDIETTLLQCLRLPSIAGAKFEQPPARWKL